MGVDTKAPRGSPSVPPQLLSMPRSEVRDMVTFDAVTAPCIWIAASK